MDGQFSRTEILLGGESTKILAKKCVLIFGVGGVGGYVVEMLARSGVGKFILVDSDIVEKTNLNRQILSTHETLGMAKTEVAKVRIQSINPNAIVDIKNMFYLPQNSGEIDFKTCDYVVDAIDTITAKIDIALRCSEGGIPLISSMGAGNRLNPDNVIITDIYKTENDPLAKVMRYELRKRGIKKLKVCFSKEKALKPIISKVNEETGKEIPGSTPFVPAVFGIKIAHEVVCDLLNQ